MEAVIDKDRADALVAAVTEAAAFILADDSDAMGLDRGTPRQRASGPAHANAPVDLADAFPGDR